MFVKALVIQSPARGRVDTFSCHLYFLGSCFILLGYHGATLRSSFNEYIRVAYCFILTTLIVMRCFRRYNIFYYICASNEIYARHIMVCLYCTAEFSRKKLWGFPLKIQKCIGKNIHIQYQIIEPYTSFL